MLNEPVVPRFACYDCDGPSFAVVGALTDHSDVVCGSCGAQFGEWKDFSRKLAASRGLDRSLDVGLAQVSRDACGQHRPC